MTPPRRGRPPYSVDPDVSHAARLGAEIRTCRQAQGLTLKALAALIGYSPQHLSEVELARAPVSGPFVAACDQALDARGKLTGLLPAVICERALQRHDRAAARHSGVAAAVDLTGSLAAQPTASAKVDPELVPHWLEFKGVLTDHDQMFGPHHVLAIATRGLGIIGPHRQAARGNLRTDLMRVEARWEMLAAWLYDDAGNPGAAASMERARVLAREADDQLMIAYVRVRQSERASRFGKAQVAIALAQAAQREARVTPHVRALSALHEALGHALTGETAACQRCLGRAHELVGRQHNGEIDSGFEGLGRHYATRTTVLAGEARCWLWLGQPRRAVDSAQRALARWPALRRRGRGLQRAGLAVACAAAGEPDRAAHEGLRALAVARATGSDRAMQELFRLDRRLAMTPGAQNAAEFREAFAAAR
jgi:transcriptional regulator with XRE-family HTH domain